MGDLNDEKIALQAIYEEELTFHGSDRISITLKNGSDGIRSAKLTLCLPPTYPQERPTYFVDFEDEDSTGQDDELLQKLRQTVEIELSSQALNNEYSLYSVIESARCTVSNHRPSLDHKSACEHGQRDAVGTTRDTAHGILLLSADELEKIFSWLDVERDLLRVSLVSRSFASCLRSNSVWRQFWMQRWGGDAADVVAVAALDKHCSRAAFRSRYASESRWETDGGQPHIRMFKHMEENAAAVCKMCWVSCVRRMLPCLVAGSWMAFCQKFTAEYMHHWPSGSSILTLCSPFALEHVLMTQGLFVGGRRWEPRGDCSRAYHINHSISRFVVRHGICKRI
jgi:hypothetical protein